MSQFSEWLKERPRSRVEAAQILIFHEGKPLDLTHYIPLHHIYNNSISCREILLKAGRQVTKSTTLRNLIIVDSVLVPHFKTLYIVPLQEQASRFGNFYLNPALKYSPLIRKFMLDSNSVNNVMAKQLRNGSIIHLNYAFIDAERVRGTSADKVAIDEVQDINYSFLPVINETLSASDHRLKMYSGTPKTLDNTMEKLWLFSSQNEWAMRCSGCNLWNIPKEPDIYKMLLPQGPSCIKCGKVLDVRKGEWVSLNAKEAGSFNGYHLPQIIIPRNVPKLAGGHGPACEDAWKDFLKKYERYPPGKFANEALGLSYDIGGRLITLEELKQCCTLKQRWDTSGQPLHIADVEGCSIVCAGIDWGISAETSFTVLTIGGITPDGIVKLFFAKKYIGSDTIEQCKDIARICALFRVQFIGADYGVGYTNNIMLRKMLGWDRILEFQYSSANTLLNWNPKANRFILDRTTSLNLLFVDLKCKRILFPVYESMAKLFDDVLSIYEEEIESPTRTYKVFRHTPDVPDDFAHSLNYLVISLRKAAGDPIVYMSTGMDSTY